MHWRLVSDGRDGEGVQLWPWRGFDRLAAKKDTSKHSRKVYGVSSARSQWRLRWYSAFGVAVTPGMLSLQSRPHNSARLSETRSPSQRHILLFEQEYKHAHLDMTVIDTTPVHPITWGTVNTGITYRKEHQLNVGVGTHDSSTPRRSIKVSVESQLTNNDFGMQLLMYNNYIMIGQYYIMR